MPNVTPLVEDSAVVLTRPEASPRLRAYQRLLIALMVVGYAGYYLCRSDLSVATPLLIGELKGQGVDKVFIGGMASLGTLFYAFGKFVNGSIADYLGGKKMFLLGMGGAVFCTVLFGLGGVPVFTLAWVLNRAIQSTGWVGMVKMTSRWFSYSTYGAVMGVISLSYLFGDFASRQFLGQLIKWHYGWRQVFFIAAGVLFVIFLFNLFLLKDSPNEIGEAEPDANPVNLFGEGGQTAEKVPLIEILLPLMRSPLFWVVCVLSLGFTLLRETFNTWTPLFLTEIAKMKEGDAAQVSSYFPLFGGLSVLLAGFLSDRLGRTGRAALIFVGIALTVPALLAFTKLQFGGSTLVPIAALGTVAFVMIGPYSLLAGAISLDFGGKRGSATVCGWIDGIGYLGGILAGEPIGKIAEKQGWNAAFLTLTGVAVVSCLAAVVYWVLQARSAPGEPTV